MRSEKRHMTEGIELQNQEKYRMLREKETYKYLIIFEVEMKEKLKQSISGERGNNSKPNYIAKISSEINAWSVLLWRYSAPFLKWMWEGLKQIDQRTRKPLMMQKALHPWDDVDRRYVSRKGRIWLASYEDSVDISIRRLEDFIKIKRKTDYIDRNSTDITSINGTKITRKNGNKN